MKFYSFNSASLASIFAITSSPTVWAAAENRRLNLNPGQSIAAEVRNNGSAPGLGLHLTADTAGGGPPFEVNVRVALPAVTAQTTTSVMGGEKMAVDLDSLATILVSDDDDSVALMAVQGDDVNGIVQRGGKGTKFTQKGGRNAFAYEAEDFEPPAWECGVGSSDSETDLDSADRRFLTEDHLHDDHHHHDHHDHDHHDHDFSTENTESALADLRSSLRGSNVRLGKRRKLEGAAFNYQVDVYVEIDYTLCNDNGETCTNGIGPNTLNYVNALFSGANTIYESEIDTHLGISHIDLNRNYDSETSTSNALSTMRSLFAASTWHYANTDLHTALLSKSLGGGIAYVGVLCRSDYGYGLSASLSGSFASMDNSVVWDMMVFMHELGHNFGTGHTHQDYSPVVDTCGSSCPSGLPLSQSTTIMSYCHLCSGGYGNMMYTFGGKYNGGTDRGQSSSYDRSPLAGSISDNPQRVNAKMWNHVSSRGSCLSVPSGPATANPTSPPTTANPTSPPTTANPTSPPTLNPTKSPVPPTMPPTNAPSKVPTAFPTGTPTVFACINFNQSQCNSQPLCTWHQQGPNKHCKDADVSPSPPSPSPPSPSPPTPDECTPGSGGRNASCSADSDCASCNCKANNKCSG